MAREAERVRALVAGVKPELVRNGEVSERALGKLMGGRWNALRPFDTAARTGDIPATHHIATLAAVLAVDFREVFEATTVDAGLPLGPSYDREQHRAALLIAQIPEERRGEFVDGLDKIMQVLRVPS